MKRCETSLLGTPVFIASIGLLALNDFFLKSAFHNWFTGKLSDFAGLIAVTVFASSIWPSRRWLLAIVISASFALWKSPFSEPLIDFTNAVLPFNIGRTVDYTDYIAVPAVWLVALFIFRLRPWSLSRLAIVALALFSLTVFTATVIIPVARTTRTAVIPVFDNQDSSGTEKKLEAVFDNVANQHGLQCMVCDPFSSGRLYVKNQARPEDFSLAVNFDFDRALLFFDVSSVGIKADNIPNEINSLRAEIETNLQNLFPKLTIEESKRPKAYTLQLGVGKRDSPTASDNQKDYEKAIDVIQSVVSRYGLKRFTSPQANSAIFRDYFYTGKLFGPLPSDHEFVVWVGFADWPLVPIEVTSYSPQYSGLQRKIVDELEIALKNAFGDDRAWIRWGSRK
jgi:hypothetical protein